MENKKICSLRSRKEMGECNVGMTAMDSVAGNIADIYFLPAELCKDRDRVVSVFCL